jgi:hypothetical protein
MQSSIVHICRIKYIQVIEYQRSRRLSEVQLRVTKKIDMADDDDARLSGQS